MPGTNLNRAIPALVNCAVPNRWMSVQEAADASQSVTLPRVTFVAPELTVAVNVTAVPEETLVPDERVFVPAAMTRSMEVGEGAAIASYGSAMTNAKLTANSNALRDPKALLHFGNSAFRQFRVTISEITHVDNNHCRRESLLAISSGSKTKPKNV